MSPDREPKRRASHMTHVCTNCGCLHGERPTEIYGGNCALCGFPLQPRERK